MADLTPVYAALQQADAAGDTAGAQKLADYIRSQGATQAPAAQPAGPIDGPGLTARALNEGAGTLADVPGQLIAGVDRLGKAIVDPVRNVLGLNPSTPAMAPPLQGGHAAGVALSDAMGLPRPATPGQRVYSAAVGQLPLTGLLGPEAILPGMAGGAASQAVQENGGTGFGSFLASLLAGGAAGAAQGGTLGALQSQATTPAAGTRAAQVAALNAEGIDTNLAQATGNKVARHIDRASQMVTRGSEEFAQKQVQQFNGAVLKRAGVQNATAATPDVLDAARTRIGSGMDAIEDRSGADFDTQLASDLQGVQRSLLRTTPESDRAPLLQNINDIIESASQNGGTIPGATVRNIRGTLATLQKNPALSSAASDAQEALQNAVARSSAPQDVAAYSQLRQQYRALKQIQDATDPKTGNIYPTRLMTVLGQAKNDNQVLYGKGDQSLVTLARNAANVLPDTLGNSGTAERFIPTLTLMESLQSGNPTAAAAKTILGMTGIGGAARLLRNQAVVRGLTSDRLSDTLSGAAGGAGPGAVYGAAGNAADDFLRHLDWIEGQRQQAQIQ